VVRANQGAPKYLTDGISSARCEAEPSYAGRVRTPAPIHSGKGL
jgi:hypothetical protein